MSALTKYRIKRELAEGRSGKVELAASHRGSPVVLKKMHKLEIDPDWVRNEVRAGELLKETKGIVRFREHFDDESYDYIVVDYIKGEDLFVFMENRSFKPLKERFAQLIVKQLARSLQSCHRRGIAHKDIKLENICIDKHLRTTIIDFGFCEFSPQGYKSNRWDGTPEYASPEVLLNLPFSTHKSDVYSLGVVLFTLVTGMFPFELNKRCKILKKGGKPKVDWNMGYYPHLSSQLMELIDCMLDADPEKRIDMRGVLDHKWVNKKHWLNLLPF
jgi:MAP/microtubule affinity-regulating kinase